ncbi:MAG TPA: hypothetical protein VG406_15025 [Isosphaeraceae bacterium]|jgi:hypothetical protein|nr:hypothetical protein [Isosphaeraceae bacterium]
MQNDPRHRHAGLLERLAAYSISHRDQSPLDHRRAANRALRDAIAGHLGEVGLRLEQAIRACVARGALSEVAALERLRALAERIAQRVRHAGPGSRALAHPKSPDGAPDPIHALDLDLYHRVEVLLRRFDAPDNDHDFLPAIMAELTSMERRLDDRAFLIAAAKPKPVPLDDL